MGELLTGPWSADGFQVRAVSPVCRVLTALTAEGRDEEPQGTPCGDGQRSVPGLGDSLWL